MPATPVMKFLMSASFIAAYQKVAPRHVSCLVHGTHASPQLFDWYPERRVLESRNVQN